MLSEPNEQLESTLDLAAHLVQTLPQCQDGPSQPCPDVSPYVSILPFAAAEISKAQRLVMRDHSIKIWNSCNAMSVDNTYAPADLAKIRAFAYLLLSSAIPHGTKRPATTVNLFKNALVAGKACVKANVLDLADKVMQNEAAIEVIDSKKKGAHGEPNASLSLVVEYYCLRALLEWKRKRSDPTDYWYKRMLDLDSGLQECDIEKIVDLFYEIGRDCLSRSDDVDIDGAAKWLERAQCMLERKECSQAFAGSDLRINVMHNFVQALIRLPGHTHEEQAWHMLKQLRSEYGPRLPILLLILEVVDMQPSFDFDADTFATQLQEIIRSVHLIDVNHRLVMHYIRRLDTRSHFHALECIKVYILHRLITEDMSERKQQAIVEYIAMVSENQFAHSTAGLQTLEQDLTRFAEASESEFSSGAAQAAHVLI